MGLFTPKKSSSSSKHTTTTTSSSPGTSANRQITTHPNTSTSNFSTTSTLLETPTSSKQQPSRPAPPQRQTSYEAFLHHARVDQERSDALKMEQAWREAERRRKVNGQHWPNDPWRGGFGPPSTGGTGSDGVRGGWRDVGDWLRGNGLSKQ